MTEVALDAGVHQSPVSFSRTTSAKMYAIASDSATWRRHPPTVDVFVQKWRETRRGEHTHTTTRPAQGKPIVNSTVASVWSSPQSPTTDELNNAQLPHGAPTNAATAALVLWTTTGKVGSPCPAKQMHSAISARNQTPQIAQRHSHVAISRSQAPLLTCLLARPPLAVAPLGP